MSNIRLSKYYVSKQEKIINYAIDLLGEARMLLIDLEIDHPHIYKSYQSQKLKAYCEGLKDLFLSKEGN